MERIRRIAAILSPHCLLWLVIVGFMWSAVCPFAEQRSYVVAGDLWNQYFAFHHFSAWHWWQEGVPLWNPFVLGGHPFQADSQSAVFYPLSLLFSLLSGPDGLTPELFQWRIVLDLCLAASFGFLLVRRLSGFALSGIVGGLAFALGGYLTAYPIEQLAILESSLWLPLALLFIERGFAARRTWGMWMAAGLALGTSVLAGHPQTAAYVWGLALAYSVFKLATHREHWKERIVGIGLSFIIALALSAVQLLPTLELTTLASRGQSLIESPGGYTLSSLPGLLLPEWRGEVALYAGTGVLLLAILSFWRSRAQAAFWGLAAMLAVIFALGEDGFLFPALRALIPGLALFRDPERGMLVFSLACAILAGLGLAVILRNSASGRPQAFVWLVAAVLATTAATIVASVAANGFDLSTEAWHGWLRIVLVVWPLVLLAFLRRSRRSTALVGVLVAFVCIGDIIAVNHDRNLSSSYPLPKADLIEAVRQLRDYPEPFRIGADDFGVWPPFGGSATEVPDYQGDSPLVLSRTEQLLKTGSYWRLQQLYNVRYLITRRELGQPYQFVRSVEDKSIYAVPFTLPRCWVVTDYRLARSPEEALALSTDEGLDLGTTLVLEDRPSMPLSPKSTLDTDMKYVSVKSESTLLDVKTRANGLLAVNSAYYPGWHALIDGREVPVLRANYAFLAIELEAGAHTVEFRYRPWSVIIGGCLSALAILVSLGMFAFRWHKRRGRTSSET